MASNKPLVIGSTNPIAQKPDGNDLDAGSGKVINVLDPVADTDAATKAYADALGVLRVTYTGTPRSALALPLVACLPIVYSDGSAPFISGPAITTITYSESNATTGNVLTSISFDNLGLVSGAFSPTAMAMLTTLSCSALTTVGGIFAPATMAALTTLSFPALTKVSSNFAPATMAALTTLYFPALTKVGNDFAPITMGALTTLSCPALTTVSGVFAPAVMAALTTLSFPALTTVGGSFAPTVMAALTTLSFPALTTMGQFSPSSMAALTTVNLPAMVAYGSTIAVPSASMGNVNSVVFGTSGTLKSIGGATITLSGLKLDVTSVNALLALLVSLDGTNGTTAWGTGKTLTIGGGTNAAPTGQGITDKATLITRGATITTN